MRTITRDAARSRRFASNRRRSSALNKTPPASTEASAAPMPRNSAATISSNPGVTTANALCTGGGAVVRPAPGAVSEQNGEQGGVVERVGEILLHRHAVVNHAEDRDHVHEPVQP